MMGTHCLDDLARRISTGVTRRGLISTLAGAVSASTISPRLTIAACKNVGKKCAKSKDCCIGATCKKKKCACKSSRTACDQTCVDLDTDSLHCGACNNSCIGRATCQSGSCIAPKYVYATQWGSRGTGAGEFRYPAGLALSSYGMVYVADLDNNRVQAFDADGAYIGEWGTEGDHNGQFTHPLRVAVAPDEAIYVTDGSDRVQRFDIGGNFQVGWDGSGGAGKFGNPRGVVITPDSEVYIADTENNRIQLFDTDGDFLASFGSYGHNEGELSLPAGLALDADGNLLVADSFNHRVQKFDATGQFLFAFGGYGTGEGEFDFPQAVTVAPNGDIFVADTGNDRIQQFDSEGQHVLTFGSSGSGDGEFDFPEVVAVAANGDVYVTDSGNQRIQVFTPA
jgi:DNA-binding beta-propeller fold protein YncE